MDITFSTKRNWETEKKTWSGRRVAQIVSAFVCMRGRLIVANNSPASVTEKVIKTKYTSRELKTYRKDQAKIISYIWLKNSFKSSVHFPPILNFFKFYFCSYICRKLFSYNICATYIKTNLMDITIFST